MRTLFRSSAAVLSAVALTTIAACGGTGGGAASSDTVTVYSADGLGDWYAKEFKDFTARTGVKVSYVEGGSGEVVSRIQKEQSNPQADVLVTLPPFIQQADADGALAPSGADVSAITPELADPSGKYVAVVNNYFAMIRHNGLDPKPDAWTDLTSAAYKQKIQYSTPGQAGDGTAMLLLVQHVLGDQQGLDYLKALQANNVGPSSSTGKLGPKVSKGELSVANSDLQMALASIAKDKSAYQVFYPTHDGKRTTLALPYYMGLTAKAPHSANGRKLIEFLLSKEVQQTVPSGAWGAPVRTDVAPSGPETTAFTTALAGVDIWYPDWNAIRGGIDALVKSYNTATGQ
ncbi:2-aminoethylphosphonate ABC transporter substrate-binding protein [Tsukamurella sp. 8F]|uniref:2-aminoethylphosphonate ABC transporter substrate-binding protein n=1 Tax=unclassified Tsukamurella TaxID=2633480 RepID=UPI0023B924E7|nr:MULTISPECIES: 2-aminoethylphosphonate ABC transporter substrate-binding protein [unclassified Tsukamurella]MDF0529286.1 2-aminoethylphosphonate ABC transporter substrate-binding protein [Tsukamurella sp. 8J]MDF0586877.1 2-aminoethylphosphonate ABC transporter substrate-binding protein [Tsukamurella sp. 8F]